MRALLAGRWLPAALVAAALLAVGGGAYAAGAGNNKLITVCVHKHGGGLYKARKCAKHDKKLKWNQVGPTGARGATGAPGPGATTLTFDANASPTPTRQTLGTVLGDTIGADCFQLTPGKATLRVYLQTSDGSWANDSSGTFNNGSAAADSQSFPAGTFTSPTAVEAITANAAPDKFEEQQDFIQLSPARGHMIWHLRAETTTTSQTCHLSVQAFPSS